MVLVMGPCAAADQFLRFPDVWHEHIVFSYAGDLWTVGTEGGTASRLTSHPGQELFAKFSPDGSRIAFTGQYGGDEQVYVIPAAGGAPQQLTFYPANGPLPERWGYDNQVYGWTPDGRGVLFRSARDSFSIARPRLYTVPADGGAAAPLPMPVAGAGHFSPDGRRIVYSPRWRDFRNERHYQGGWANDLYLFDLGSGAVERITDDPHTDRDPMWIGNALYFNSDRDGTFNLYRYDLGTRATTELTHYREWDLRWPSADDRGQIVYELHGELHLYDTRTGTDRAVAIRAPLDDTRRRPEWLSTADQVESFALSPDGRRLAVVARGDVYTLPVDHGASRNLTHSSDAHEREAAWSGDGRRLAYVSDRSGEEQVYVQDADGFGPAQAVTQGPRHRYFAPLWSPDDRRLAYSDQAGRLLVTELATRRSVVVAQDAREAQRDYRWSRDGRFLAYSLQGANGFAGVFIWSSGDGSSRRVTPEDFQAHTPAWSPDGELLYFLSEREGQPVVSGVEFEFATTRATGIFALALRRDGRNPFRRPTDVAAPGRSADERRVAIDFDGLMERVIRVPLEPDDLEGLEVTDEDLVYARAAPNVYGRDESRKTTLMAYSIKDQEAKAVTEDAGDWSIAADGRHVAVQTGRREIKLVEIGTKNEEAPGIPLDGLATLRIPLQEWHEIFAEVWRRYRDYFYVENMHGYDWEALRRKYEPRVEEAGNRADLNAVIAEMIAELTVQHAYIEGGDLRAPKRPFVALPGARFELDAKSGRYRIARILRGQNEEETYRSPLTEVGVDVHAGDYVLTINGRELGAGTDPYELLQSPPNEVAEWRVSATADGSHARTIQYRPLATEGNLLYLEWVTRNRARVDAASGGRLGYLHLPDMEESGLREFIKGWYPQVRREGLIVDVRDNAGGDVSPMLIERLARKLGGMEYARNQTAPRTYPTVVQPGPKAALIDETTASDGDLFANAFRTWKLGPLIGQRTWGGAVGIMPRGPLLDGGIVSVPEFGNADAEGRWMIEGHGVDPDISVEEDPVEVLRGRDPQLERAIAELLRQLPATPAGLPGRPVAPVKTTGN
jgi:tricorn protease